MRIPPLLISPFSFRLMKFTFWEFEGQTIAGGETYYERDDWLFATPQRVMKSSISRHTHTSLIVISPNN